jgi:hypothetical protein
MEETTEETTYLTRNETAERLGVSTRTVSRDMRRGRLWYRRHPVTGRLGIRSDSPLLLNPGHKVGCLCEPCNRPAPQS